MLPHCVRLFLDVRRGEL